MLALVSLVYPVFEAGGRPRPLSLVVFSLCPDYLTDILLELVRWILQQDFPTTLEFFRPDDATSTLLEAALVLLLNETMTLTRRMLGLILLLCNWPRYSGLYYHFSANETSNKYLVQVALRTRTALGRYYRLAFFALDFALEKPIYPVDERVVIFLLAKILATPDSDSHKQNNPI